MHTTRFASLVLLLAAFSGRAERVVIPVAIFAAGSNGSLWTTEVRITNPTAASLSFRTVDLVLSEQVPFRLSFQPAAFSVAPATTRSFGAYELQQPALVAGGCHDLGCVVGIGAVLYGAYEMDIDNGLSVEAAVLTGVAPQRTGFPTPAQCKTWEGGYVAVDGPPECNQGAGPLLRATRTYYGAGAPISLNWLHTHPTRRTNVTLYNPDALPASVTLTATSADGLASASTVVEVPGHSPLQVNDLFSSPPFDAIRMHNASTTAAARATIVSTTRLYAIGWVISNQNNTVTISEPR